MLDNFEQKWESIIDMTDVSERKLDEVRKEETPKLYSPELYVEIDINERVKRETFEDIFDTFKYKLLKIIHCKSDNIFIDYCVIDVRVIKIPDSSIFRYLEHEKIVEINQLLTNTFVEHSFELYGNLIVINTRINREKLE